MFFLFIASFCCLYSPLQGEQKTQPQNLPDPYNNLTILPELKHGWYGNAQQISRLVKEKSIKTVVEIGSWLGLSTCHIASILPEDGMVYAVDHWLGSIEHQEGQANWHPSLPNLYEQFLSNVVHAGLTGKITPCRMDSLQAAQTILVEPDLIYVDAGHDFKSVYNDLNAWFPFVKGHGVLSGDDWGWDSVRQAVLQFAKENNLQIHVDGGFWYYTET